MKKLLLIFILMIPFTVHAINYDVDDLFVDAQILENGDMKVKELIVLTGTFHGYERMISYRNSKLSYHDPVSFLNDAIYNGSSLENVILKAKKINEIPTFQMFEEEDFITLEKAYYKEDAEDGEFVESSMQDGKSYRMYFEGQEETIAFYLEYKIPDVIVKHEDVAEIYWTFIGDEFDDAIQNVEIRVSLPKEDNQDTLRFWAHGDLNGEIQKLDNQTIVATIQKLKANSPVDIRMTFDKTQVNVDQTKITHEIALPQILEIEEKRATEANETRERAKKLTNIVKGVSISYIIFIIFWWIYIYIFHDREYKSEFQHEYNREFIDRYNVEVVDVLMNGKVTENALTASILNLIYKKNIAVEEKEMTKKKSTTKYYEFTLLNKDNLNNTEESLVHFLFEKVGSDNKFTSLDLKEYATSAKTYQGFHNSYTNWRNSVKNDADRQKFYEENGLPVITGIFLLLIALFINFFVLFFGLPFLYSGIVLLFGASFFIYSMFIKKRTKEGNEDYVRWKAMKRFLKDFGNFEIKELPEIALWERYFVYATVFGIADQVEKSMNVKIKEMDLNNVNYNFSWIDFHIATHISSSIHESIRLNESTYSARVASSTSSSGSGFGGGFSSGGGFGGGGGGGHGF